VIHLETFSGEVSEDETPVLEAFIAEAAIGREASG